MVRHIVFWRVKGDKKAVGEKIRAELLALRGLIPELREIEVGLNFNSDSSAYDVALYSTFDSRAELETYQNHPEHKRVAMFIQSVREERVVVDYEI